MENPNGIVTLSMLGIEGKGSVQVEIRDCNTFHLLLLVPSDEVNLMSARGAIASQADFSHLPEPDEGQLSTKQRGEPFLWSE